jgi:hypothetical protein
MHNVLLALILFITRRNCKSTELSSQRLYSNDDIRSRPAHPERQRVGGPLGINMNHDFGL